MNIDNILSLVAEYIQDQDKIKSPFVPGSSEVPVSGATITPEDVVSIVKAAMGRWYTEGDNHKDFSLALKRMLGNRPVTLCNSGSSALLLATAACKDYFSKDRGYVITCATGFPTTIAPAIQLGFIPYFVDVDLDTLNVNIDTVLELLKDKDVAGVILTHTLGFPFDAPEISYALQSTGKFFIEDCADALGASIRDFPVGVSGDASIFSFFPAHHITTGEGGAVSWYSGRLAKVGNSYCSWGRDCWCKPGDDNTCNKRFGWEFGNLPKGYDHKYTFTRLGYNLKMTELQAALGVSQFSKLDDFVSEREKNFFYLCLHLSCFSGEHIQFVHWDHNHFKPSPFGFPITVTSKAFTREELVSYLELANIRTRPIFAGNLARQPMMQSIPYNQMNLHNSDYVMNNSFWIGCHDGLSIEQLDYVIERFHHFFRSRGL